MTDRRRLSSVQINYGTTILHHLVVFVFLDVFFKEKFLVLKKIVFFIVASSY
jgi:hypothetical protein